MMVHAIFFINLMRKQLTLNQLTYVEFDHAPQVIKKLPKIDRKKDYPSSV